MKEAESLTWLPYAAFEFDTLLFRELLAKMEEMGYTQGKGNAAKVHVCVFRRFAQRVIDAVEPRETFSMDYFHKGGDVWLSWPNIRDGVKGGAFSPAKLNWLEVIKKLLEEESSCIWSKVWNAVLLVATFTSVILMVLQSLDDKCPVPHLYEGEKRCGYVIEVTAIQFFSIDYMVKAVCAPFCRLAIFERQWLLQITVPEPHSDHDVGWRTRLGRLSHFIWKPMNLVDLCAVAPFWLTLLLGTVPVPSAVFRTLRLFRVVRLFRIGRFNTTLLVLGSVLAKSFESIYVILVYIVLTCLIAGGVLDQMEAAGENGIFESVPRAGWWVFTRMTGVNDKSAPLASGQAGEWASGAICMALMVWKNLLWILPFGQIGTTFKEESAKEAAQQDLVQQVRDENHKEKQPGFDWMLNLTAPAAHVEVWECSTMEGRDPILAGVGALPLPLFETSSKNFGTADEPFAVTVHLHGSHMQPNMASWLDPSRGQHASLQIGVAWNPSKGHSTELSKPKGSLSLEVIQGRHFRGSRNATWTLRVMVPEKLYGGATRWETIPSVGDVSVPTWPESKRTFHIDWEEPSASSSSSTAGLGGSSSLANAKQPTATSAEEVRQACFKEIALMQEQIAEQTRVITGLSQRVGAAWESEGNGLGVGDGAGPSAGKRSTGVGSEVENVAALVPLPW